MVVLNSLFVKTKYADVLVSEVHAPVFPFHAGFCFSPLIGQIYGHFFFPNKFSTSYQIFDDADKSELSCIIVDDIERLLGMSVRTPEYIWSERGKTLPRRLGG